LLPVLFRVATMSSARTVATTLPSQRGARPDLKDKITVPDVLLQADSASLGITFYTGQQFPPAYSGNVFAAEHGSWERSKLTEYKVMRDHQGRVSEDANVAIWRISNVRSVQR
jgi:glucose/arabinose dehydrogenase